MRVDAETVETQPPPARVRLARPLRLDSPFASWTTSIAIALMALFFRLWKLGTPHNFSFDETYYAKDAWSLLNNGYVQGYTDGADEKILQGQTHGLWTGDPSMEVHPEFGKWLIALGEKAFGMDPFGWRVASAVAGALMVLVMIRLARRLTGSMLLAGTAGLLLSFDGLQFVLSRLALLDIFLALFMLMGVHCVVADREWWRARLAALQETPIEGYGYGPIKAALWRPWLIAGGVSFGLACGVKWSAFPVACVFGLLVWAWSAGARHALGVKDAWLKSAFVDGIPAFVSLIGVGLVVYTATWTGWLIHHKEYEDHLSSTQYTQYAGGGNTCDTEKEEATDLKYDSSTHWGSTDIQPKQGVLGFGQALWSLGWYHHDVYMFHTHFLNCATHTYASKPISWLIVGRPVGVEAENGIKPGEQGCQAAADSTCLRQVLLIGTPVLWWVGAVALVWSLIAWLGTRDWRHGVVIAGVASTWLPWFTNDDRPIFYFYAVTIIPFTVLSLVLTMGQIIGPDRYPTRRRTIGVILSGLFTVLVVANFAWFWPIFTDGLLTRDEWVQRVWFTRWI